MVSTLLSTSVPVLERLLNSTDSTNFNFRVIKGALWRNWQKNAQILTFDEKFRFVAGKFFVIKKFDWKMSFVTTEKCSIGLDLELGLDL